RTDLSDQEYNEVLAKIDALKIPYDEVHKLQWTLHRRETEVAELQQALSETQTQLFDERKLLLKAIADNDELKIQELKDRKKVRYLLSVSGTPEEEVTYFRDSIDKRFVKVTSSEVFLPMEASHSRGEGHDIVILEDEIEALRLTVSSLHTQMDEMQRHYEETIAGYQRDRKTVIEEQRVRREHDAKKISELTEKVHSLRLLNRENIRELLQLKKSIHRKERKIAEEKAAMTQELLKLREKAADHDAQVNSAVKAVEVSLTKRNEAAISDLKFQLHKADEELRTYKTQVEEADKVSAKKTNYLSTKIQALTTSYNSLKRRREYEIEGFTNDILLLRKQLRSLEKSILKYGPLEDKELILLSLARETSAKATQISTELQGLKTKVLVAERDLRSLPI
ncbi:hypothetical protein DFJ73DRAFT_941775, partial [Zopfochytrium polystomum]